MRMLVLLILLGCRLCGQTLTTISQLVTDAHGVPFVGFIQIQVQPFSSSNVAIRSHDVWLCSDANTITGCLKQIVAGVVTVQLAANGGATPPGTSYRVTYYPTPPAGTRPVNQNELWVVPTGGPYTINEVKVSVAPSPLILISPTQLDASGYAAGAAICSNGTSFVPGVCTSAGGAVWGAITGLITDQGDLQTQFATKQATIAGAPGSWPNFAPVATSGSAADLTTGKLPAARLSGPGPSTLGGVQSKDCSVGGTGFSLIQKINTDGSITCIDPVVTPPIPVTQLRLSPVTQFHAGGLYAAVTDGSGDSRAGFCVVFGGGDTGIPTGILVAGSDDASNCLVGQGGFFQLFAGMFLGPAGGQVQANVVQLQGGARPTCNSGQRASFWQTFGGAGVADTVAVCARDAGGTYAWRTIF